MGRLERDRELKRTAGGIVLSKANQILWCNNCNRNLKKNKYSEFVFWNEIYIQGTTSNRES